MAGARPDPLHRIDSLFEMVSTAHLAIYEHHRRLVSAGREEPAARQLLDESVHLALTAAPAAVQQARELAYERGIRGLLSEVEEVDRPLDEAVRRAESDLLEILRRQQQIAEDLVARVDSRSDG